MSPPRASHISSPQPVLHWLWVLPHFRPHSSADWTTGRCSSPEHVCQTSLQTASRLALFQRNLVSEDSTMEGTTLGRTANAGNKGAELCFTMVTCVSGSRVNSLSLVSPLILDSLSLALWRETRWSVSVRPCMLWALYEKFNFIFQFLSICASGK